MAYADPSRDLIKAERRTGSRRTGARVGMSRRSARPSVRFAVGATLTAAAALTIVSSTAAPAAADVVDCRFGTEQVFDVQWYIFETTLHVFGMDYPHSEYDMFSPDPPATRFDATTLAVGDYFQFQDSITEPGALALAVYTASGDLRGVIHDTGTFRALGDEFFLFYGHDQWGTLFTTVEGFQFGDAAAFAITNAAPTTDDLRGYTDCASAPVTLPVIGDELPDHGVVGTGYSQFTVPVTGAGVFTFAVTSGALPDGLVLDPATGSISGTPTVAGVFTVTVTVTGSTGAASVDYTITVADPVPSTDPPSTDPPSTDPPSTDPPSTDPPSTDPPSSPVPTDPVPTPPAPTGPGPADGEEVLPATGAGDLWMAAVAAVCVVAGAALTARRRASTNGR